MSTTRKPNLRVVLTTAAVAVLVGVFTIPAAVADPPADREAAVAAVEAAYDEATLAAEQVNQLDVDIERAEADIAELNTEIAAIQAEYDVQRSALGATIVQQQLDAPLGPTVSLLASGDTEKFLDGLGAVQALQTSRADALEQFTEISKQLANRRAQLEGRQSDLESDKAAAVEKREEMDRKHRDAEAQLARLTPAEQRAFNTSNVTVDFPVEASGRGGSAVDFAISQLGIPYRYGGADSNGYDCSGLTMAAFAAAGISIPRVAGAQYAAGQNVPMNALAPGDLVFYGNNSHVGIYIGDGRVVHSPRPGRTVEVTGLGGFSKAARFA